LVYYNLEGDVVQIDFLVDLVVVSLLYQQKHNYFHNDKQNENAV
jgi:hypothetical protein